MTQFLCDMIQTIQARAEATPNVGDRGLLAMTLMTLMALLPNNWPPTSRLVVDGTRRLMLDPPYINTDRATYTKLVQNSIYDPGGRQSKYHRCHMWLATRTIPRGRHTWGCV